MNLHLKMMFARLHHPAGDDGSDTGGTDTATLDRGDDFIPTAEDLDAMGLGDKGDKAGKAAPAAAGGAEGDDVDPENPDGEAGETKEGLRQGAEGKPDGKKGARIPLDRHEKILAKERERREALERELAKFQQGQEVARTNEELTKYEDKVVALERQYADALADGESAKAAQLMREIRHTERLVAETRAEMREQVVFVRAREAARYDITLERIEEAYPQLNPDADEYDAEVLTDVADLKAVYEKRGMPPAKALQAAVKKLLGSDGRAQETATSVTARVTDKDIAAERKKGAVAKAVDAARRTPPSTRDVGMDTDKAGQLKAADIMKMKQEDFAALTEEQLAKLRGDDL